MGVSPVWMPFQTNTWAKMRKRREEGAARGREMLMKEEEGGRRGEERKGETRYLVKEEGV